MYQFREKNTKRQSILVLNMVNYLDPTYGCHHFYYKSMQALLAEMEHFINLVKTENRCL